MSLILDIKYVVRYIRCMESLTNPTRRAARRYTVQLTISMVAYVIVLVAALRSVQYFDLTGSWRVAVLLLPLIPVIAIVPTVVFFAIVQRRLVAGLTAGAVKS